MSERVKPSQRQAQGPWCDLALHTLGWKAFQDLCSQVCAEVLKRPVEIYREAQDGGQDAVFLCERKAGGRPSPATVQCKFSSKSDRRLGKSDLNAERDSILKLLQLGEADTYILMTSMGVDAGVARSVKGLLRQLGVRKPHILGREFLTLAIRSSARLRAMVPQVYGIGDLSVILDERRSEQTRALLGQWLPTLKSYVPTAPHRNAVRVLAEHRIVLLLGNAAAGKSTLAAILSTMACDGGKISCFQTTGPRDFDDCWNPNETSRFYWIDDAFGANQPRDEYIQDWANVFRKVQAATAAGNRFVLTSRRHIYEAAKIRLGSRNLSVFSSGQAVVDVGALTLEEKRQILYNHIKTGAQNPEWKRRVKDHLEAVAEAPHFLPGMARRLGDPMFTKRLPLTVTALREFVSEPRDHLIQTIEELSDLHQAALALIFVHRGRMPINRGDEDAFELVSNAFNVDKARLIRSIRELQGSFVEEISEGGETFWIFDHPTILDAATEMFRRDTAMTQIFLLGATFETITTNVVCAEIPRITDAMVVQRNFDDLLVRRLAAAPDDTKSNSLLFSFLASRASDSVFSGVLAACKGILKRNAGFSWHNINYNPKILTCARAHQLGLLDDMTREDMVDTLDRAIFWNNDLSFIDNGAILYLIPSARIMRLTLKMRRELLSDLSDQVAAICREPDLDVDPSDNFQEFNSYMNSLREFFFDDRDALDIIAAIDAEIESAVGEIKLEKAERERALRRQSLEDEDAEWNDRALERSPPKHTVRPSFADQSDGAPRSVFSDVDQ